MSDVPMEERSDRDAVVIATAAPGQLAHFPDVARLRDGRLLATYRESAGHVGHNGRIALVESTDDGRTWSTPRVVVDGDDDDRDPKLGLTREGTVLLSYFVTHWKSPGHQVVRGTYVRRSGDSGRTWSDPAVVGDGSHGDGSARRDGDGNANGAEPGGLRPPWRATHGCIVQLRGGDLLAPLYGTVGTDREHRAIVVRGTDDGRVWHTEAEVTIASAPDVHFQEPSLTVLGDGQVVALIRTTTGVAYLARSFDEGRTWTGPEPTDLPASSHHILPLDDGSVLVTYGDTSGRFSPRRATTGRLIRDPYGTWNGHRDVPLYDSGTDDQANPSSVELSPGRFLTLSCDVTRGTVVSVESRRDEYADVTAAPETHTRPTAAP